MVVLCELCGKHRARYVCEECGKKVCSLCFDLYSGLCKQCLSVEKPEARMEPIYGEAWIARSELPILLILLGVVLSFIGALLLGLSSLEGGGVSGSVVIIPFIPIPVGIAFGPYGAFLAVVTSIAAIILLIVLILWWRRLAKNI
ncbi:MAG: B-box zinc finger protein [Candidatus Bathyarchaeia archaeon]